MALFTVAWGRGRHGVLGSGTEDSAPEEAPHKIGHPIAGRRVAQLCCGELHTLALMAESGAVFSWGSGLMGALGHGGRSNELRPRRVDAAPFATQLTAGKHHSAALCPESGGTVFTWGWDGWDGSPCIKQPAKFPRLERETVQQIAAGAFHLAALTSRAGVVTCGGTHFQSGLLAGMGVVRIAAGMHHTAALTHDASVYAWNHAVTPILYGVNQPNHPSSPMRCDWLHGAVDIACCGDFIAALLPHEADGRLVRWQLVSADSHGSGNGGCGGVHVRDAEGLCAGGGYLFALLRDGGTLCISADAASGGGVGGFGGLPGGLAPHLATPGAPLQLTAPDAAAWGGKPRRLLCLAVGDFHAVACVAVGADAAAPLPPFVRPAWTPGPAHDPPLSPTPRTSTSGSRGAPRGSPYDATPGSLGWEGHSRPRESLRSHGASPSGQWRREEEPTRCDATPHRLDNSPLDGDLRTRHASRTAAAAASPPPRSPQRERGPAYAPPLDHSPKGRRGSSTDIEAAFMREWQRLGAGWCGDGDEPSLPSPSPSRASMSHTSLPPPSPARPSPAHPSRPRASLPHTSPHHSQHSEQPPAAAPLCSPGAGGVQGLIDEVCARVRAELLPAVHLEVARQCKAERSQLAEEIHRSLAAEMTTQLKQMQRALFAAARPAPSAPPAAASPPRRESAAESPDGTPSPPRQSPSPPRKSPSPMVAPDVSLPASPYTPLSPSPDRSRRGSASGASTPAPLTDEFLLIERMAQEAAYSPLGLAAQPTTPHPAAPSTRHSAACVHTPRCDPPRASVRSPHAGGPHCCSSTARRGAALPPPATPAVCAHPTHSERYEPRDAAAGRPAAPRSGVATPARTPRSPAGGGGMAGRTPSHPAGRAAVVAPAAAKTPVRPSCSVQAPRTGTTYRAGTERAARTPSRLESEPALDCRRSNHPAVIERPASSKLGSARAPACKEGTSGVRAMDVKGGTTGARVMDAKKERKDRFTSVKIS
ncbi:hypothetical protein AB1Y20_006628 [Prymnesium parvum]|uniref:Uncharacterized protein n=1 Tax=Prymnesium parvum TaxID=97485 RepID=A0AB34J0T3_PRYPA